jgi:HK97 family phage major capsid protein
VATLQEILDEQARVKNELQRMEDDDSVTEEDSGDMRDTLVERWEMLDKKAKPLIERMEKVRGITRAAQDEGNLERPAGQEATRYGVGNPDLVISGNRNPYDCQDMIRNERQVLVTRSELKSRALDAIEMEARRGNLAHDFAEEATAKAQSSAGIARHMLLYGSQEYQDAFRAYTEDPEHLPEVHRAALTLSLGSVMLPFVLDPTIVLTNSGSANPWRRVSNVKTTTSNTWNGVSSAGVTAAWLTEGTIVTDGTPTVASIAVTPQKAAAWVYGSYELLEDTDFGQQLPRLLADAKDRLEEAAFATGGGSGGVPQGVVNGATTVVTTATTTVIALGDVYATQAALPPRFRNAPGAAWVANVAIINKVRQLDTAGGSSFWTNLGKGQPETLLGAPIYESTTMSAAVSAGSLEAIFGDFGQFIIVDRVGVSMIYDPLVQGAGGILPTGQAGWFMFWRTGSALSTVNAFRVMKGA